MQAIKQKIKFICSESNAADFKTNPGNTTRKIENKRKRIVEKSFVHHGEK